MGEWLQQYLNIQIPNLWEGLREQIYEGFVKPILDFFNSIWETIYNTFVNIGTTIRNAIIGFIDSAIAFFEYTLNYIRQYLPYAIMITISWVLVTRTWRSEKLSLGKKIAYTILSPIIGYLVAQIFNAMVPLGVTFPRLSRAIQPPEIKGEFYHRQYINETISIEEIPKLELLIEFYHKQYDSELVQITEITELRLSPEFYHKQYKSENVGVVEAVLTVEKSYNHTQYKSETVILIPVLSIQASYNHLQYYECVINL